LPTQPNLDKRKINEDLTSRSTVSLTNGVISAMTADKLEFESFEQMAATTAAALVQAAAHYAFQLYCDKGFRRRVDFDNLDKVEQDRVFNELVVTHVVLVILILEAPDLRVPREFRDYLLLLQEMIPKAHVENLRTLGLEDEHLRQWEKLIALRYDEYAKDRHEVRSAAMEIQSSEKPLDLKNLSKIQMLIPVQAVAIGCHHHICRGNTNGRDDLFKLTLDPLTKFYVDIRGRLEGVKITPLTRARQALKHMIYPKRKGK
jgi:hypothetical protein